MSAPPAFLLAGALAGACASGITTPFDVLKTRVGLGDCSYWRIGGGGTLVLVVVSGVGVVGGRGGGDGGVLLLRLSLVSVCLSIVVVVVVCCCRHCCCHHCCCCGRSCWCRCGYCCSQYRISPARLPHLNGCDPPSSIFPNSSHTPSSLIMGSTRHPQTGQYLNYHHRNH